MIKCQICGHDNPDGTEYCEDCGASLSASPAPQSGPAEQATPPPAQGMTPAAQAAIGSATPPASAAATGSQPTVPPTAAQPTTPEAPSATGGAAAPGATPPSGIPVPPSPAPGQSPRLVAHRYGAPAGEEYPLLGERLVVGRFDPETGPVDIDLSQAPEAPQLSRHHAELYREADGRWHVKDLGSTNGVFVKRAGTSTFGPRLTAPEPLASGDEVAFGNARFIFRMD